MRAQAYATDKLKTKAFLNFAAKLMDRENYKILRNLEFDSLMNFYLSPNIPAIYLTKFCFKNLDCRSLLAEQFFINKFNIRNSSAVLYEA